MTDKTFSDVRDLASFGARPLFDAPRHVNRPGAPARADFEALVDGIWQRRWFTNDGPLVKELESRLAVFLDVPHCVLTCNATAALGLVLGALEVTGEVLLPSYTFISTAHVLHLSGMTPVFCDVAPDMNIAPSDCVARMTERTGALIATHVWGRPCEVRDLEDICAAAQIPLLFDAAHAFGSRHMGRRIGAFGVAEVFSLHATKAFHACEGGLVTTADGALAQRLRMMRNFGFSGSDRVDYAGVNAKMSELHAAMGLANLDIWPETKARSCAIHEVYQQGLGQIGGLDLRVPPPEEDNNHHYVVAEIDAARFGMDRDRLCALLEAENVLARRYFFPGGHRSPPHDLLAARAGLSLPETEALCNRVLVLPGGAAADPDETAAICGLIRFIADNAAKILRSANG